MIYRVYNGYMFERIFFLSRMTILLALLGLCFLGVKIHILTNGVGILNHFDLEHFNYWKVDILILEKTFKNFQNDMFSKKA